MTRVQIPQVRNLAARLFLGSAEHRISHYVIAILAVAVAIIAAEFVTRLLHTEPIASLMLCAVIFAAWFAGFVPALLAITLALLAFHYYLVPPVNSFTWKHDLFVLHVSEVPRLILFSITSLLVACVISAQKIATDDLGRSGDDLKAAMEDQKRTEAALLHSEMYLTEAQRLSGTGSFGWSISTGEVFWSDETFRIFGCDRATKPTTEFIVQRTHPEDRAAVQKIIDRASRDGTDFDHEYRLLMSDGSVKYVRAVVRAARGASSSVELLGAVTDVTVAKETERKLRRSESYLDEAQRLSHTSSWAWDVQRRAFAYRSTGVYYIFGFDPEKGPVPLQAFRDCIHPEDRARNIEAASRAIREKANFEVDFRIVLPNGSIKHVHFVGHTVVNSDGVVTELIGTHMEVTEQFEAKEKLQRAIDEIRKSEDHLRLVIDTIRRWSGAPDRWGFPISSISRPSTIPGSHLTKPLLPGLARSIRTTRRACCKNGAQYGPPVCEANLKPGSGASMVNIAGFCSRPNRCAMSWATLSNGMGRPPTSRTAGKQSRNCGEAKPS
jgi:PAS domain S-box-containing protein